MITEVAPLIRPHEMIGRSRDSTRRKSVLNGRAKKGRELQEEKGERRGKKKEEEK